eukprot:TRINITY_DN2432_c0_g2_i1.p1 TRINITY_DN2432_c0_g2~~TRINITY_DN2432_c0_g2_i1.p1  ORF type:complete len:491 (-),score=115.74 TRINITY_DN2432_c0_g2_i1:96-1496(-)
MDPQWKQSLLALIANVSPKQSQADSAATLRRVVKSGLISLTDVTEQPERFFLAHRLIARATMGAGFWVRYTVHYNLCYGTVVAAGGDEQLKALQAAQKRGALGCFALTERFAGVNSGLVVQTLAHWKPEQNSFVIHSPTEGSVKNWISQGAVADQACVVADLVMPDGTHKGPHAFLIDMRNIKGELLAGITTEDMGEKTMGNDLDNAWIKFTNVVVPKSTLLNRYCDVDGDRYVKKGSVRPFEVIGQRLFSGRIAVAQGALEFSRGLFENTKAYTDAKACWAPRGQRPALSNLPQLKSLYAEHAEKQAQCDLYASNVEKALCAVLRERKVPDVNLQLAIAVAKVYCVETVIWLCFRLKQEVGSYALMGDTAFASADFMLACKFAEGDSRILQQKMARDRVALGPNYAGGSAKENEICLTLLKALKGKKGAAMATAWDEQWENVFALAQAVTDRVVAEWLPKRGAKL